MPVLLNTDYVRDERDDDLHTKPPDRSAGERGIAVAFGFEQEMPGSPKALPTLAQMHKPG
jgi:hypothetical protein